MHLWAAVCLGLCLVTIAGIFLSGDAATPAAFKLGTSALLIGLLPGSLLVMLLTRGPWCLLEVLGLGIAASIALVEVLTVAAISLHLTVWTVALALVVLCVAGTLAIALRRGHPYPVRIEPTDLPLLVVFALVGAVLYLKGAPFASGEDQIHISVVRRLAFDLSPALDNIYYSPHIVYTYPFPGTHFLMALITRLSGLDALFVYYKMRFFWGVAAELLLYSAARKLFGSRILAFASSITASVFVLNGTFADVTNYFWGQMAPYSHASDVALNVIMPALLVAALYFLGSGQARERRMFLVLSLVIALTLTIVHIREMLQALVYFGAFAIVLALGRHWRKAARVAMLEGLWVAIVLGYGLWQSRAIGHVDVLVSQRRSELLQLAGSTPVANWITQPLLDNRFSAAFSSVFLLWQPLLLLCTPLVLLAMRRRAAALLVSGAILVYLLILRFSGLTFAYLYAAYFEAMYVPARNTAIFVYLMTGPVLLFVSAWVATLRRRLWRICALVGAAIGATALWILSTHLSDLVTTAELQMRDAQGRELPDAVGRLLRLPLDAYFLPAIALYIAVTVILVRRPPTWRLGRGSDRRLLAGGPAFIVLLAVAAFASFSPDTSPAAPGSLNHNANGALSAQSAASMNVPRDLLSSLSCLPVAMNAVPEAARSSPQLQNAQMCPPPLAMLDWARTSLAPNRLIVADTFNPYAASEFLPQQIVSWPLVNSSGLYFQDIFPAYYAALQDSLTRYHAQPFFNDVETPDERVSFVRRFQITDVLADPAYYSTLKRVLATSPTIFVPEYDDGSWAMFRVNA
ncbi:MAG: hypothetical protein JOZ39_01530 [Chloroflexi bacterium]|nr:hypothetical protein [Chloroflexota bacterium]